MQLCTEHFLQFFFWNGLNENFQDQLINITNHTRPSLQETNDNFFEATERYLAMQNEERVGGGWELSLAMVKLQLMRLMLISLQLLNLLIPAFNIKNLGK